MRLRRCLPFAVLTNVLILTDDSPNRHGRAYPGLPPATHALRHGRTGFRGCPDQVILFTHKSALDRVVGRKSESAFRGRGSRTALIGRVSPKLRDGRRVAIGF
jgi:hypothetical protein